MAIGKVAENVPQGVAQGAWSEPPLKWRAAQVVVNLAKVASTFRAARATHQPLADFVLHARCDRLLCSVLVCHLRNTHNF